jgi:hypothetical protein
MHPEREGFPFNMPFPVFQEGKPRDPPSLAFGLGPGFSFNSPFERMKGTNSALRPHCLLEVYLRYRSMAQVQVISQGAWVAGTGM